MKKLILSICCIAILFSCKKKNNENEADQNQETQEKVETIDLNVMSFNIRYDNPEDGENNWKYRKNIAAQVVKDEDIDLMGAQEVLVNQLEDLQERLPEYATVGVGREDGVHKGEHSSLFYKKDRFEELDSGDFWLSETPDTVSVGWDAALERIASWALLKDKESGKSFLFMNVHFDHIGKEARRNSVSLMLDNAHKFSDGLPIIMTGDFNARPESDVIRGMTDENNAKSLIDSREIAADVQGSEGTFHDFDDDPDFKKEGRIDYIFVNDQVEVKTYKALPKKMDGIFLSDHVPIMAEVSL